MGIASEQEIPSKPEDKKEWTWRRLFPFSGAVTSLTKVFVNPFDILLGFLILILGIVELIGRGGSFGFWIIIIFVLFADLAERHKSLLNEEAEKGKKK